MFCDAFEPDYNGLYNAFDECEGCIKRNPITSGCDADEIRKEQQCIRIWAYGTDVPKWVDRHTPCNGDDCDWVAFVPMHLAEVSILWLEQNTFGNDVVTVKVDGGELRFSFHA